MSKRRRKNQQRTPTVSNETRTAEEQLEMDAQAAASEETETQQEESGLAAAHFGEEETGDTQGGEDTTVDQEEQQEQAEEDAAEEQEDETASGYDVPETPDEDQSPAAEETVEEKPALPSQLATIQSNLEDYAAEMGSNVRVSLPTILTNQRRLANVIASAFTADAEHQRDAVNMVYAAFRKNENGAFSPRLVFRGVREMAEKDSRRAHTLRSGLTVIQNTLDGATREQTLQHMDFGPLLDEISDAAVRAGIISYLGLGG